MCSFAIAQDLLEVEMRKVGGKQLVSGKNDVSLMRMTRKERQYLENRGLVYLDPDYIQLKVGAESTVSPTSVHRMVKEKSLDEELRIEQTLREIDGAIQCFLCQGHGSMEALIKVLKNRGEEIRPSEGETTKGSGDEDASKVRSDLAHALIDRDRQGDYF